MDIFISDFYIYKNDCKDAEATQKTDKKTRQGVQVIKLSFLGNQAFSLVAGNVVITHNFYGFTGYDS